jgi:MoaA/NifB/PqqE/SkfB family radical SAM enzyme
MPSSKSEEKGWERIHEKARMSRKRHILARALGLALSDPKFIRPYLRLVCRKNFMVPFERRFKNGYAALPARIQIHPTRRCNLKCEMCIQHRHSPESSHSLAWYGPENELPLEAWIRFLDQVCKFRPWINISGGEPMLYAGLIELIHAADQRALPVEINTNGTLLTRHADQLVQNGVALVSVSVDGPENVHDMIRGQAGLFSRSMEGIAALFEAREIIGSPAPIIQIACTVSKDNAKALKEMVPLAIRHHADVIVFQHTDFNTQENIKKHNLILSAEKARAYGLDIVQPSVPEGEYYQSRIGHGDVFLIRDALSRAKAQADGKIDVFMSPNIRLDELESYYFDVDYPSSQSCVGLWTTLRVMPDGTALPCLHARAGNIKGQDVSDIWNGRTMRNLRRLVAKRLFPGCARCCHRRF